MNESAPTPRAHRSADERRQMTIDNGHTLDPHAYGEGWAALCNELELDPLMATADDVLADTDSRLRDNRGDRVLSLSVDVSEAEPHTAALIDPRYVSRFTDEVAEIAGLTNSEAAVVQVIVDGVAFGRKTDWTLIVAERLETTPGSVRVLWHKAKRKLEAHWAAESLLLT